MKRIVRIALGALVLAGAPAAQAHEAWLEPAPAGGFVVQYGHGAKKAPADPARVRELNAFDAAGRTLAVTRRAEAEGLHIGVAGVPALLTVFLDNGFWSRSTPDTPSRNLPMNENPGATSGTHALKTGKTVLAWGPAVTQPRGLRLEIVPLSASAPAAGGTLAVQVLWEGRPLAGARLAGEGHEKGREIVADATGRADVPVSPGWQMVVVGHELPTPGDPRADKLRYSANLYFSAP